MSDQSWMRAHTRRFARSRSDRGLPHGPTGNIPVRLEDDSLLVTPTGSSFCAPDPADIAHVDGSGRHGSGLGPTGGMPRHAAPCGVRGARPGHLRPLPPFRPDEPATGRAMAELDQKTSAVILARSGQVVAGLDLSVFAMEELEATARLAVDRCGEPPRRPTAEQVAQLVAVSDPEA
jgi:ribulose-5-phosphate 4-epimerase/fuculose-1-phosphate aldolase